ncbi:DeoR family transcriptional regulator [Agromyces bauzanensis]|uniref:DeoR family transcriptional regulator n=1 Tax=Agromyces bauzanensis TaxID=1308924 RepID=UPI00166DA9C4|nr:DeoR family transcriptional regulator [Agromyces bauzanensis]
MSKATERRRSEIVSLLEVEGSVTIQAVAQRFDVSIMTARRDAELLVEEGRVRRLHGRLELAGEVRASSRDSTSPRRLTGATSRHVSTPSAAVPKPLEHDRPSHRTSKTGSGCGMMTAWQHSAAPVLTAHSA